MALHVVLHAVLARRKHPTSNKQQAPRERERVQRCQNHKPRLSNQARLHSTRKNAFMYRLRACPLDPTNQTWVGGITKKTRKKIMFGAGKNKKQKKITPSTEHNIVSPERPAGVGEHHGNPYPERQL